jgi:hypothetical protein
MVMHETYEKSGGVEKSGYQEGEQDIFDFAVPSGNGRDALITDCRYQKEPR